MTTSTHPHGESIVDWAEALDRVAGSQETLDELVEIFLEQWPHVMDEIEQGVARADHAMLHRAAHTLKGSAAIFGAHAVVDAADRLSEMGRTAEFDGADDALLKLQDEMERLVPEFEAR